MLIPTSVNGHATLAVPGTDYWAGTAAHYYINPPGTDAGTACVWGSSSNPWGNWSPYVAGANQDASGAIYIKLGWNPIYLEAATPFRNTMPSWGVEIDCPNGGCSGLPCSISPSTNSVNQMAGSASNNGAGGSAFCVITVNQGATANFVISEFGGNGGSSSASVSGPKSGGQFPGGQISGGQFYATTASITSAVGTTTSKSTTTTTTTTLSSSVSSSSSNFTMSSSSSSSWPASNSTKITSTSPTGPTGSHYPLFSESYGVPQTTAIETAEMSAQSSVAAANTSPVIATHTGAAAVPSLSLMALVPLLLWKLLI